MTVFAFTFLVFFWQAVLIACLEKWSSGVLGGSTDWVDAIQFSAWLSFWLTVLWGFITLVFFSHLAVFEAIR